MERKLASIQVIDNLEPIENADSLDKATVLGWSLVVKKGEFQVGDKCVYCEIDSLMPDEPEFEFLKARGFRIRTIKLRGQLSQGIAFPMSILEGRKYPNDTRENPAYELNVGDEVSGLLGVTKYEPPIPAQLAGIVRGSFPGFIKKTDEIRIQSEPKVLERHAGKVFYTTEKLDGSSMTVFYMDGEFDVCSRNLNLKEDENNSFWKMARKLNLENKLKDRYTRTGGNLCIQGELIGNGIQGNRYNLEGHDFYVFNVYSINTGSFVDYYGARIIAEELGLKMVPHISEFVLEHSVDDLIEMVKGKSVLNPKQDREGLVFRPIFEDTDPDLGRLSFKCINNDYLLKNE